METHIQTDMKGNLMKQLKTAITRSRLSGNSADQSDTNVAHVSHAAS